MPSNMNPPDMSVLGDDLKKPQVDLGARLALQQQANPVLPAVSPPAPSRN